MSADIARLESVAQQLAARVRDDDPADVWRWLGHTLTDPADWFRLAIILAAAVPADQRWSQLIEWIDGTPQDRRLRQWRDYKQRRRAA